METWTLTHPTMGVLTASVGWPDELRDVDPGFGDGGASPLEEMRKARHEALDDDRSTSDSTGAADAPGRDEAQWKRRLKTRLNRNESWGRQALVLTRDGVVFARAKSIRDLKIRLTRSTPDEHFTEHTSSTAKPRVEISADPLGRHVIDVLLRTDDEVLAFEPPTGSPGARRHAAMDASPWKRVVYPVLGGLGKSGWALFALLVMPLVTKAIGAFIAWLLSFLPPIHLPSIPWPTIHWPSIDLPDIPWPDIHLPDIPLPHVDLPPWLDWLLEHPKVWTPVLLAIFWGLRTSRNHRKSQAKKAEWAKRDEYARLAGAMRGLHDRRFDDAR